MSFRLFASCLQRRSYTMFEATPIEAKDNFVFANIHHASVDIITQPTNIISVASPSQSPFRYQPYINTNRMLIC